MIVTSLPRSGSTKFCSDLSANLKLPLYDEIFEYEVAIDHKEKLHQISDAPASSKDIVFLKSLDFKQCVINNHEISFFTLENTDVFLSRQNIQDSVWSWLEYIDRYLDIYLAEKTKLDVLSTEFSSMKNSVLHAQLERLLKRTRYFYEYCVATNKEIIVPDLTYRSNEDVREKFKMFSGQITRVKDHLVLPSGFIYE
jgi:hypothetical protein